MLDDSIVELVGMQFHIRHIRIRLNYIKQL